MERLQLRTADSEVRARVYTTARKASAGMRIICAILIALGIGCWTRYSEAGEEMRELLQKMQQGKTATSYVGEMHIVHFSGKSRIHRYAVMRQGPNFERKELVADQGGKLEVTLSDGKYTWSYLPARSMVIKRPVLGPEEARRLMRKTFELIEGNYAVRIQQEEVNVGGRKAAVVEFIPKDVSTRPLRRIWVDKENGVALRTEVIGPDRSTMLLSYFSKIRFTRRLSAKNFVLKVPRDTAVRPVVEKAHYTIESVRSSVDFPVLTPGYLPRGFALLRVLVRNYPRTKEIQIQYSDGLSTLSLFQDRRGEPTSSPPPGSSIARARRPVAVGEAEGSLYNLGLLRLVNWGKNDNALALVGELEETEMLEVAKSVE